MGVFQVFKIAQMVTNRAKRLTWWNVLHGGVMIGENSFYIVVKSEIRKE